jgi:hypothetical protein
VERLRTFRSSMQQQIAYETHNPMRTSPNQLAQISIFCCIILGTLALGGCSRDKYRLQADREAYEVIAERNSDPRWHSEDFRIDVDPRSRFYDPTDPDRSPMPQDDPASHRYMRQVNGIDGWKHWDDNGNRTDLENPAWRNALSEYVKLDAEGKVMLDLDAALRMAYVNSPSHQQQLETLYLSALDVSAERFRLDTQFFGGYDTTYVHNGSLVPAGLTYSSLLKRYVITPPIDGAGIENNRLTVGSPSGSNPTLQAKRQLATAGEIMIGFANSFVFEFTEGDGNLAVSLANFAFIQPLLRGAGKDIALEQLTLEERVLLANLRAYSQYRQGFYTQIAIGELGVAGPQRHSQRTSIQSHGGQGGASGYLGLLQQLQQIRNSRSTLNLQIRTRDRLEALLDKNFIDLVQVDQFRQGVEAERSSLLQLENTFELGLDRYKTSTLGLPPSLPIELDDRLIRQFQLMPSEAVAIQNSLVEMQTSVGALIDLDDVAATGQGLQDAQQLIEPAQRLFIIAQDELARMNVVAPSREADMDEEQRVRFASDRSDLDRMLSELEIEFDAAITHLNDLRENLTEETRYQTSRELVSWVTEFQKTVGRLVLVPARARLESVTVVPLQLDSGNAFDIALANRLDFMNGRAALVDRWRSIQTKADALQAVVNIKASGDVRTASNNPLDFNSSTGNLRLGLEFDAPLTRVLERNAYRESLIDYQRSRREFIQSQDSLELGLRALFRQVEQLRQNLEIQRGAVSIAIRQVDQTQLSLNPPRHAPQPGTRPPISPTTAMNLLNAQNSLRNTQNSFLSAWISYYAARMRLYRELGIMRLDIEGHWTEHPTGESLIMEPDSSNPQIPPSPLEMDEPLPAPPEIPVAWIDLANQLMEQPE